MHICIYIHVHIYIYIYICVCEKAVGADQAHLRQQTFHGGPTRGSYIIIFLMKPYLHNFICKYIFI